MDKARFLKFVPQVGLVALLLLSGCVPQAHAAGGIPIGGPADLYYMSVLLNQQAQSGAPVPQVDMNVATDSITELKEGKIQAALLGSEPTAEELKGLTDYVIAYDAVCIIIDDNSFIGGVYGHNSKDDGLQELSTADLKSLFSPEGLLWNQGYYAGNSNIDPSSWLWNVPSVVWIPQPKTIVPAFVFPPGKFDTQSVIYQDLGLDEKSLLGSRTFFNDNQFDEEEEVLSYEYGGSAYSQDNGVQPFAFKVGFASRQAMTIAPQHIPVDIIPIDGINPLESPQAVYDGSYIFSRKIHLLVRNNSPAPVQQIAQYLTSNAGQQVLTQAGYLPVTPQ